ncbi:3-hydroxybutyryl-CoA dehydrogenase [bacterium]|nr:3-hydroxybutyryl-CoA dehydrogenase [bacterium]
MAGSGISRIGVIGIGTMGSGIAQTAAQQGFDTVVVDISPESVERGMAGIRSSLDRMVGSFEKSGGERGISGEARDATLARLQAHTGLEMLTDRDIIIEAAVERLDIKEEIYARLVGLGYNRLLVSNTSSISITRLAAAYGVPENFMGMHFMNPVPIQPGVEIIRGLLTSDETHRRVVSLCHELGKTDIPAEDKAGFGVNRMWVPFVNEAVRVVEEGVMTPDEADRATQLCLAHKMGPLMTADFVGLDVVLFICNVLSEEFGSAYTASPLLKRLVEAGQLGAKSGAGFYLWEGGRSVGMNPAVLRYRTK